MKKLLFLGLVIGMAGGAYAMEVPDIQDMSEEEYQAYLQAKLDIEGREDVLAQIEEMDDYQLLGLAERLEDEGLINEAPTKDIRTKTEQAVYSMNQDALHRLLGIAQARQLYQNELRGFIPGQGNITLGQAPVFTRTTTGRTGISYTKNTGVDSDGVRKDGDYDINYTLASGFISITPNWGVGFGVSKNESSSHHDNTDDETSVSISPRYSSDTFVVKENLNIFGFEAPVRFNWGATVGYSTNTSSPTTDSANDEFFISQDNTLTYGNHILRYATSYNVDVHDSESSWDFTPAYKYVINDYFAVATSYNYGRGGRGGHSQNINTSFEITPGDKLFGISFISFNINTGKDYYNQSKEQFTEGGVFMEYPFGRIFLSEAYDGMFRSLALDISASTGNTDTDGPGGSEEFYQVGGGIKWTI